MLISAARLLSWDWTTPQSLEAVDLFKLFSILENLCCYHEADGLVLVTAGFQSPALWVNLLMSSLQVTDLRDCQRNRLPEGCHKDTRGEQGGDG